VWTLAKAKWPPAKLKLYAEGANAACTTLLYYTVPLEPRDRTGRMSGSTSLKYPSPGRPQDASGALAVPNSHILR
jgi:hypothetical protein